MALPDLTGLTVGITADRRAEEQGELLGRRGLRVVHGPVLRTVPLTLGQGLQTATEAVIATPPDAVVLSTGVGVRAWLAAAESLGLDHDLIRVLNGATVLARGPKAAGAAVTGGVRVDWRAPSEQGTEVAAHLAATGLATRRVAVQRDGGPVPLLANAIRRRGADVVDVPVYRWDRPTDPDPARRLIEAVAEARVDGVTFTSTPAVEAFMDLTGRMDLADRVTAALAGPVVIASVGPVCTAAVRRAGLAPPVEPGRARLGSMVLALATVLAGCWRVLAGGRGPVVLAGSLLTGGGHRVELAHRERAVLVALAERAGGAVVTKRELLRQVWRDPDADDHVVEVTVGRLRRRVEPAGLVVETVPRRGYRLAAK